MEQSKIVISAYGTHGDVQPMLAIALNLIKKEYDVLMVVCRGTEEYLKQYKVPYVLYGGSSAREQFGSLGSGIKSNKVILKNITSHMQIQAKELPDLCRNANLLIGNSLDSAAPSVAELCEIPYLRIALTPIFAGDGRPTTLPLQELSKKMNAWIWKLGLMSWEILLKPHLNKFRKILNLKPVLNYYKYIVSGATILALDKRLAPPSKGWPKNVSYSGYPFFKTNELFSQKLQRFIDDGEPPVYFGFGSMGSSNPEKITQIILETVKRTKIRAIISKGWANLGGCDLPENVIEIDSVCHSLLFPQLSGVVHHGGAGTTHSVALAGIPQLVVPHITDQFYYGQSVFENNLGPKPIPFKKINTERLVEAILTLRNPRFRDIAKRFANTMRTDGVEETCNMVELMLSNEV